MPPRVVPYCDSVHPRARGEHSDLFVLIMILVRFIPAHAGNMRSRSSSCASPPVHPRARGEHAAPDNQMASCNGSSPRTRGTWIDRSARALSFRFIPAHAGNMPDRSRTREPWTVHPRARGEHPRGIRHKVMKPGSSPRTRGTFKYFLV